MKWTIELAIAVAVTAAVWALFHALFPGAPLDLPETVLVLAVVYALVKGARYLITRRRADDAEPDSGADS